MKRILRIWKGYALTKHKLKYLNIRYLSLLAVVMSMCLYARAQRPDDSGPVLSGIDTTSNNRDTIAIEEIQINTGYQVLSKERATGSFEYVPSATLQLKQGMNLLDRLDGTSSILFDRRNNNTTNLQIRGLYSLDEKMSQPLIVVDNFPFEGDIESLNPAEVASVTILKDAAAASIWGSRAGNGVLVITTKKGMYNQPMRIDASAGLNVTSKPNLKQLPILLSNEYIDLEMYLYEQGAYNASINSNYQVALTPVIQLLHQQEQGLLTSSETTAQIDRLRGLDVRDDFSRFIYRNSSLQQYQLTMNGGGKTASYRLSLGYDNEIGQLVGDKQKRYTLRFNNRYSPTARVELSTSIQFMHKAIASNSLGPFGAGSYDLNNALSSGFSLPIYAQFADNKGLHLPVNKYRQEWLDTIGGGRLLDWDFVPLDEPQYRDLASTQRNAMLDMGLRVSPHRYIDIVASYRYQYNGNEQNNTYQKESFEARNLVNLFTNRYTDVAADRYPVPPGGFRDSHHQLTNIHNLRTQFELDVPLSDVGQLTAIAGTEVRQIQFTGQSSRSYGYDARLNTSSVDFVHNYTRILGFPAPIPNNQGMRSQTNRYVSMYGNAAYNLADRYVMSVSARSDAANMFGVDARNRWKPLYSMGLGWTISNEPFYSWRPLSYLRIRATFGYQGNVNNGTSAHTQIQYRPAALNSPLNIPFASLTSGENPALRWETVRQFNVATDFAALDNVLSGGLDIYFKRSSDVLALEEADPTTGFLSLYRNSAGIVGRGIEVRLQSNNLQHGKVNWRTNFMLNMATYKVSEYHYDGNRSTYVSSGSTITPMVGYHPYALLSYRWAGLDPQNGNPRGYLNGQVSDSWDSIARFSPIESLVFHGPALPTVHGSLLNRWSVGNLEVAINITYKMGYFVRANSLNYQNLFSVGQAHISFGDRWKEPGDERHTQIPSMVYPNPTPNRDNFYNDAEIHVYRGDHIRLQQVRLSYHFKPAKWTASQLKIFAYADQLNAVLWRASPNLDPEFPEGMKPGKIFSFGLSISL